MVTCPLVVVGAPSAHMEAQVGGLMTGTPTEGGFSISRCPDVIYFAAGQSGICSENGQHVLQKALFLESVWLAAVSLCVCVCLLLFRL